MGRWPRWASLACGLRFHASASLSGCPEALAQGPLEAQHPFSPRLASALFALGGPTRPGSAGGGRRGGGGQTQPLFAGQPDGQLPGAPQALEGIPHEHRPRLPALLSLLPGRCGVPLLRHLAVSGRPASGVGGVGRAPWRGCIRVVWRGPLPEFRGHAAHSLPPG